MSKSMFEYIDMNKKPPTRHHRPAVWENMLGTVLAMNGAGEIKYFDYDHHGALRFSGALKQDCDLRWYRKKRHVSYTGKMDCEPKFDQYVLWVKE